jgi:hypothetical protein
MLASVSRLLGCPRTAVLRYASFGVSARPGASRPARQHPGALAQWQSSGLLIRWFRVRPPGAPPLALAHGLGGPWTDSWTDVTAVAGKAYAGTDPLTGRETRFRKTRKTEVEAQVELGKLLDLARAGRQPNSDVTMAELLDQYVPVAGWDLSTQETKASQGHH